MTGDLRAINHILTHSTDYQKPGMARHSLGRLIGEGTLVILTDFCPDVRSNIDEYPLVSYTGVLVTEGNKLIDILISV